MSQKIMQNGLICNPSELQNGQKLRFLLKKHIFSLKKLCFLGRISNCEHESTHFFFIGNTNFQNRAGVTYLFGKNRPWVLPKVLPNFEFFFLEELPIRKLPISSCALLSPFNKPLPPPPLPPEYFFFKSYFYIFYHISNDLLCLFR